MMKPRGINGYGYQWRISPGCCKAADIEAGDVAPCCDSTMWFWLLALGAVGVALFAPKRGKA